MLGIFIIASGIKIRNIMGKDDLENYWDHFPLTCQYWAGIPVSYWNRTLSLVCYCSGNISYNCCRNVRYFQFL